MKRNDKREYSRLTVRDDVTLVIPGVDDSELCVLEDISKGGARFFTTRNLTVGNRVELRIPSPEHEPDISIQAKILRVGPGDYSKPFSYACEIEHIENA